MYAGRSNTLRIHTPEGVAFTLQLAGPVTRFLAWFCDLLLIGFLTTLINFGLIVFALISLDLANAIAILAYFILSIGYGILTEWYWSGQTVGKRLLRLRVIDSQGLRLKFNQVVIRNLLRFVDSLPLTYLVGGLACFFSPRAQRVGDMAANTIVVWLPQVSEPDLAQVLSDHYNSLRDFPILCARLRQSVSHAEAEVALQALLRRDDLEPAARIELFGHLAAHFQQVLAFPQETTDGLSAEQYTRNVVDVLFNTQQS